MVLVAMATAIVGGIVAYLNIGRLEDPEFTIKQALIITPLSRGQRRGSGAGSHQSHRERLPAVGAARLCRSESSRGRSVVSVYIKDRYDKAAYPAGLGRIAAQDR